MFDCTTPRYADLYARWLENPGSLLDLAKFDPKRDTLLDLCGGTGAVAEEAIRRGAEFAYLLDKNPRCDNYRVQSIQGLAENIDLHLNPGAVSLIVCRQAMGYLDPKQVAYAASEVLRPGGRFVFSTFVEPERASVKTYKHKGSRFAEGHLYLFGRVFHLQAKVGIFNPGYDVSVFKYHSTRDLLAAFVPFFNMSIQEDGRSQRWVCVRKEQAASEPVVDYNFSEAM